ncbi:metallophosphoesterase [Corynebacterium sp. USCH3]|uniref:metallophosphoesterase n=1 Tax=Corynebacterium sp. USCH3 TaxID=3024840 RepID=UPI0030AC2233
MDVPKGKPSDSFWLVSDLHLGHRKVAELRGFGDTDEHDRVILNNLRVVPDGATVICLGDISVRRDAEALRQLGEVKEEKDLRMILLPGNHDRVHPMFGLESVLEWTPAYREVFDVIELELQVRVGRWVVLLTHIPAPDRVEDPYLTPALARWSARGGTTSRDGFDCTVHGHTHSSVPVRPKNVNVSLEATDLRPVSPAQLEELVTRAVKWKH